MLNKVALRQVRSILQSCNAIGIDDAISGKKTLVDLSEIKFHILSICGQNCIFKKEKISPEKWKSRRSEEKVQEFKSILVARKDKCSKANGKFGNSEDDVEDDGDDGVEDDDAQ